MAGNVVGIDDRESVSKQGTADATALGVWVDAEGL